MYTYLCFSTPLRLVLYWPQVCHPSRPEEQDEPALLRRHGGSDRLPALQLHSRGRNWVQVSPYLRPCMHQVKLRSGRWKRFWLPDLPRTTLDQPWMEALDFAEDATNKVRQGILGRLDLDPWESSSKLVILEIQTNTIAFRRVQGCYSRYTYPSAVNAHRIYYCANISQFISSCTCLLDSW